MYKYAVEICIISQYQNIFSEPNGREQGIVQNNHHISMVPTLVGHSILK